MDPSHQLEDQYSIDIWSIALNKSYDIDYAISIIDDTERERYQHLHDKIKSSYLVAHLATREILQKYAAIEARQIIYQHNADGKPEIESSDIFFNLSHSHDRALVAISKNPSIGVDIEYIKPKPNWRKIAQRFFHPDEISWLLQQPENLQLNAFFQLWTRKEAYIKALGTGLKTSLSSFSCEKEDLIESEHHPAGSWYLQDLVLPADYLGCVSQNTQINKMRYYSY